MLKSKKDYLGLKVSGVYSILCKCGKVFIGKTGQSIEVMCKEYESYVFYQPDISVVAEYGIESGYMHQLVKAAIEIKLHLDKISRGERFKFNGICASDY